MILICLKTCYKFCWKLALISLHSETCLSYVFHMFFICPGGQLLWLLRSFGRGWMPRCRHLSHTCAAAGRTRIFCGGMSPGMSMMALGHALTVSNLAKPFSIQLDISSEYEPLYSIFIYTYIYINVKQTDYVFGFTIFDPSPSHLFLQEPDCPLIGVSKAARFC